MDWTNTSSDSEDSDDVEYVGVHKVITDDGDDSDDSPVELVGVRKVVSDVARGTDSGGKVDSKYEEADAIDAEYEEADAIGAEYDDANAEYEEADAEDDEADTEDDKADAEDDEADVEYQEADKFEEADAADKADEEAAAQADEPEMERSAAMYTSYGAIDDEDMQAAGTRLIPLSSIWKSKQDLQEVVSKYGLSFGFKMCCTGWSFTCNKAGSTRDRKKLDIPDDKRRTCARNLKV